MSRHRQAPIMKMCAGAVASLFLLFPPCAGAATPSANAAITVTPLTAVTAGDFAAACEDGRNGQDECDDVVGTALLLGFDYATPINVCLPGTDYWNGVGPWLRAHPETSQMPAYDGIVLAIGQLYPCGAQGAR
jgi:hypothetical protein